LVNRKTDRHDSRGKKVSSAFPSHRTATASFTHDQDAPRIALIDTGRETKYRIGSPCRMWRTASAPTPDGRWLLAVSRVANRLFVVDLQTLKVAQSLGRSWRILGNPGSTGRGKSHT